MSGPMVNLSDEYQESIWHTDQKILDLISLTVSQQLELELRK